MPVCSAVTALLVGWLAWRGRQDGWTLALAFAGLKAALFWMLVLLGTLTLPPECAPFGACALVFMLLSAIASVAIGILGPRPASAPDGPDGPGLSPGRE